MVGTHRNLQNLAPLQSYRRNRPLAKLLLDSPCYILEPLPSIGRKTTYAGFRTEQSELTDFPFDVMNGSFALSNLHNSFLHGSVSMILMAEAQTERRLDMSPA